MTENIFRLQGKKLFLTYSQCNIGTMLLLLNFLKSKLAHIKNYIVAEEQHKIKGKHYHVYLELKKKCNITNARYLDWNNQHPKIEKCKDAFKVQQYCKKEGYYLTNMKFDTYKRMRSLAKAGDWKEALILLIEEKPEEIKWLDRWEKNLKKIAKIFAQKTQKTKYNKEDFKKVPTKWNREKKTLLIEGKSGYGKTQYAKTLFKNPLLVRHMDKLKKFNEFEHDGIIFDDMNFSHWPRESCIHILDTEEDSDINVKCGMVTIPEGTPRVIITNRKHKEIFPTFDKAIRRRLEILIINEDIRKIKGTTLEGNKED